MKKPITGHKLKLPVERGGAPLFPDQKIFSEFATGKHSRLERRFLAGIFENSHHSIRPRGNNYGHRSGSAYRPENLYVSSLSLALRFVREHADISHYEFVDNSPYRHLTYSDNTSIKLFEQLVVEGIETSIKELERARGPHPHLIVINEFGFPFYRQNGPREIFLEKILEISKNKNAYIICGTSHCFKSKQNVAIFSHPTSDGGVIEHPKFSPAINLGEQLSPRMDLSWNYYSMEIGRVGILVCFDAIDPTILLRQIYYARDVQRGNRINIFVIPTFSANDFVRDQAEMLSYFTKSIVIYTNHQYADPQDLEEMPTQKAPRASSHGIFIGGEDVTDGQDVTSPYKELCEILLPNIYSIKGDYDGHWGSIRNYKLCYRDIISLLGDKENDFSPLFSEILGLAKIDPSTTSK